jgi:hypothetical protein
VAPAALVGNVLDLIGSGAGTGHCFFDFNNAGQISYLDINSSGLILFPGDVATVVSGGQRDLTLPQPRMELNDSRVPTRIARKPRWAGLRRRFCSCGTMAEGTTKTAVLPARSHETPRSARCSGAGYRRQFGGSVSAVISLRATSSGMSAGTATRSVGASAASRWTKYSRAANESVADV